MDEDQFRAYIREMSAKAGGVRALARDLEISAPYLSDVILGKRQAGPAILKKLGLSKSVVVQKTVTYKRERKG